MNMMKFYNPRTHKLVDVDVDCIYSAEQLMEFLPVGQIFESLYSAKIARGKWPPQALEEVLETYLLMPTGSN